MAEIPLLVTGSTGFVGSYLVPALCSQGQLVRALLRDPTKGAALRECGAETVQGDLRDRDSLSRAVEGCRAVIHLAAVADSSDEDLNHQVNVVGSRNLAQACAGAGVKRIINVSSTCAGRSLQDAYGRTKREAEAEFVDFDVTHLRPTMIYGQGSQEFDLFAGVVAKAPRVPIPGDGSFQLRPVYVGDAVGLLCRIVDEDKAVGRTYDVAGPESLSFNDFIELLGRYQGRRKARALHLPKGLAILGVRLLGKVLKHPPMNVDQVMAFLQDTVVDIEPLRQDLGWNPRPLEEGLAEVFGEAL